MNNDAIEIKPDQEQVDILVHKISELLKDHWWGKNRVRKEMPIDDIAEEILTTMLALRTMEHNVVTNSKEYGIQIHISSVANIKETIEELSKEKSEFKRKNFWEQ